jgi:biotin-[acetyl-CoA-carboxylase] ligase BirA-like protein
MLIYTDIPDYANRLLTSDVSFVPLAQRSTLEIPFQISDQLYPEKNIFVGSSEVNHLFNHFFISEYVPFSQYDMLLRYATMDDINHGDILCFAGSGKNFHGFRQRKWASVSGNIHLSVLLHPKRTIEHAETSFLLLAANTVTQTINELDRVQQKAMIHWVNDIMIDSFKVGGVLAQTQIQGRIIDRVILGIGLNVDKSPEIENDRFVKKATHVNKFVAGDPYPLSRILLILIKNLERNYSVILENKYHDLLNYYIDHSLLIGKQVEVYSDPREGTDYKFAEGVVTGITENLELILDGQQESIRKGRIKLLNST